MEQQLVPVTKIVEDQHQRIGQLELALHELLMELRNLMQGILLLDLHARERPDQKLKDHADTITSLYQHGITLLMPTVEHSTELLNRPYQACSSEAYQALLSKLAMMHLLYEHCHTWGSRVNLAPAPLAELETLWEAILQQHSDRMGELLTVYQRLLEVTNSP